MTNGGAPILDQELLGELEDRWRQQGAPIASRLRPGGPPGSFDAVTEPLGIRVPAEARTWWGWHDGATTDGSWWMEAIDKGWTGWDSTGNAWAYDPYKVDPAIERTRLV